MANFAILRVAKINNFGSLSASGQHNFRERLTKNADDERTTFNQIEGAKSTLDLVKKVSDLLPTKRRKDAVICIEYLISASPEHFGEDWREAKNHGADYFKDAIGWLEKRHGKGNVVCTTIHLDESTPHLAAYVVPRTADGRLSAKDFVGGRSALSKMQTSFAAEVGVKHGLVRGIERSNAVHQDNAKIAPMTAERLTLRKRVKVLEDEVDRLVKSAGAGGTALAAVQKALETLQKRYDHTHKTNVQFLCELNQLHREKQALVAEIEVLREERAVAIDLAAEIQGRGDDEKAQEAHQEALEAFKEKWVGVREATPAERQHLPVVDVCGNQAVYSLGRGNFSIHTFAAGEVVPQLRNATEQQKGGIAGR